MSSLKSDQDFRWAAQQLGIDEKTLRRWLNTADRDELLQHAAVAVVDYDNSLGDVARIFEVNEQHLGTAVWYMKQNRDKERDELLQRAARVVVYEGKELGEVARTFQVDEKQLGEAVWYMKQNRYREEQERKRREALERPWPDFPGS
jgi:hypothetical protein